VNTSAGYVAMGDSYAAGIGNAEGTWDPATADKCKRSTSAWPELVRDGLEARGDSGAEPFSFTACSGAKIEDVYPQNQVRYPTQRGSWLPRRC
jgi:hypothetical protein